MWTWGSENQSVITVICGWPTQPAPDSQGVKPPNHQTTNTCLTCLFRICMRRCRPYTFYNIIPFVAVWDNQSNRSTWCHIQSDNALTGFMEVGVELWVTHRSQEIRGCVRKPNHCGVSCDHVFERQEGFACCTQTTNGTLCVSMRHKVYVYFFNRKWVIKEWENVFFIFSCDLTNTGVWLCNCSIL